MPKRYWLLAIGTLSLAIGMFLHTALRSDGWRLRERARVDLEAITAANEQNEAHVKGLRARVDALRNRPRVQERAIRNELGYGYADEIVLELGGGH